MKITNIIILSVLALFLFIISCQPQADVTPEEKEFFEEEAVAGQAISLGSPRDTRVTSCVEGAGGSTVRATRSGRTLTFTDRCSRTIATDYSCPSSSVLRMARLQCESSEDCVTGRCISRCGNRRVDAGETCSSCAADVVCADGQVCQEGACVAVEICNGADDTGDGIIDEGCDDDSDDFCDAGMAYVAVNEGPGYSNTCIRDESVGPYGATICPANRCISGPGDCNDNDAGIHPRDSLGIDGAEGPDNCYNNIDNDCDGVADDGCPEPICDDIDNDGNGQVDEDCDNDGDDYCNSRKTVTGPPYPAVCPNGGGDCEDGYPGYGGYRYGQSVASSIHPGATEDCFTFNQDENCRDGPNEGCDPYTCTTEENSIFFTANNDQIQRVRNTCSLNLAAVQTVSCPASGYTPVRGTASCSDSMFCQEGRCIEEVCNRDSFTVNLVGAQRLSEVKPVVTSSDLPQLLRDGSVTNEKGIAAYTQGLLFQNLRSGYAGYMENDDDVMGNFFYLRNSDPITTYTLSFSSALQSDIVDGNGMVTASGTYFDDLEGLSFSILGKDYTLVEAQRASTPAIQVNSAKLTLLADAVRGTLLEGETSNYEVAGRTYTVTVTFVDADECKFRVNEETTNKLKRGDFYILSDKNRIGLGSLLYQDYAGGIHSCTFYLGTQDYTLRDDDFTNDGSSHNLRVGAADIEGATAIIRGSNSGPISSIDMISVQMVAEDEYFVGQTEVLSATIQAAGDEQELLFTNNWDLRLNQYNTATSTATLEIGRLCYARSNYASS